MSELLNLAKELQEYTKVVGSHNIKIQEIVNELVGKLEQPALNENQLEVLEWLKRLFGKYDYLFDKSIFYSIYDFTSDAGNGINITFEQPLSLKEEVQVLQAFSQWALEQEEE